MTHVTTITGACQEMESARRAAAAGSYPDLLYRAVRRAIDDACESVELVTQAGGGACPTEVAALIEYLGLLADDLAPTPTTSLEAHERLFHLASVLLGWPHDHKTDARQGGRAA